MDEINISESDEENTQENQRRYEYRKQYYHNHKQRMKKQCCMKHYKKTYNLPETLYDKWNSNKTTHRQLYKFLKNKEIDADILTWMLGELRMDVLHNIHDETYDAY